MNLCSDNHEEVCFEGRKCPACEIAAEKDRELERIGNANNDLCDEIHELKQQLEESKP